MPSITTSHTPHSSNTAHSNSSQSNDPTINHLFMYPILYGNKHNTSTGNPQIHSQYEKQIKDKKCEKQLKKYEECIAKQQSEGIKITENVCKKEIEAFKKCIEKYKQ